MKKILTFAKKKRALLLNISFVSLWACFAIGYIAGTRGSEGACAAALALMIVCALPASLAQK